MRQICTIAVAFFCVVSGRWLSAAEVPARSLIPSDTVVLLEINRPAQILRSPLFRELRDILKETAGFQQTRNTREVERFQQAIKFIERSLGVDWQSGIDKLTAGGVTIGVHVEKPGTPPDVTVVVDCDDETTLKKFVESAQDEIRRRVEAVKNDAGQKAPVGKQLIARAPPVASTSYKSFTCYQVGNGHYTLIGRRMLLSNRRPILEAALDRLAGDAPQTTTGPPASLRLVDENGQAPNVLATLNLKLIKQDPKTQDGLKLPANDLIAVILVGGYADLIRRADYVAAGLFLDGKSPEFRVRFPVGAEGVYPGLKGYFATDPDAAAAPRLNPPGTIFSASWFRDYARMWDARNELFNPDLVKQLETENAKQRKEGLQLGLGDIVKSFGPHFRFVVAQKTEQVYKINLEEPLPAFAAVIDLRDEQVFRDKILANIDRVVWAVGASILAEVKNADYGGAKLTTVKFAEDEKATEPDKKIFYHFNPAYTVTRGHLIVGSTAEIVRNLVDEVGRAASPATGEAGRRITDQQKLSLGQLVEFLKGYQPRFVKGAVLQQGLTVPEAEREIGLVRRLLLLLDNVTTQTSLTDQEFEVRIRIGQKE